MDCKNCKYGRMCFEIDTEMIFFCCKCKESDHYNSLISDKRAETCKNYEEVKAD